ncbi:cadmium-translocating P-type ATPase [Zavarzinia compransoris]|uniref:heavy metal translocating P-type ATPase n=1 Tax=Zavarzinia marina TaxID=2911065 RepID=UPI001F47CA43|nr:cation-translocating P-type ATPase [Zavarzinia marina]MCF4166224.1 cadmium-translocating P-type ATPase [Zavarzinia marina]
MTTSRTATLRIEGMTCASCVARVEKALKAVPGVADATVNLATEIARVAGDAPTAALIEAVEDAGYDATPATDEFAPGPEHGGPRLWEVVAGLVLAAPLVLLMLVPGAMLPAYVQLAIASVVQAGLGWRFYWHGFKALRAGAGNMDVLVALGTSAAYGLSLYLMVAHGGGHLYFEASASVIALVLLGKYMEARAKRETGAALRALARLRPDRAIRLDADGRETEVPADSLKPGDRIVVRAGARLPADGEIEDGASALDESLLTGESLPVQKQAGDPVVGGSVNGEGRLIVRVTVMGEGSFLGSVMRMVADAQAAKPPIQRLVDRIAAIFVPVVVAIAVITMAGWFIAGVPAETAIIHGVAVLVIACPCALGLATPAAIMVGTGLAAKHGILIRDPAALEEARRIDLVIFDKTGTLTEGKPRLVAMKALEGSEDAALAVAAALQGSSDHPLGLALRQAASDRGLALPAVAEGRNIAGRGVAGKVGETDYLLGSARAAGEAGIAEPEDDLAPGATESLLLAGNRLIARFAFEDSDRPGAAEAVVELAARKIDSAMLSGDRAAAARTIAARLNIADVTAEVLPGDKAAVIGEKRKAGHRVAMVGDGLNDAPALAAADLGIAMAGGVDVAMASAGITLMRPDPLLVPAALDLAAAVAAKIRSNLFWAFAYNVVGIPLAAFGLLSPVVAGVAMAASSVSVLGNALLLRRWHPARKA